MLDLSVLDLSVLAIGAVLVGFAKTAISGVGAISVALFAAVLMAKSSTGALLPLLLVGDLVAVRTYRRHADWATLLRLFPSVAMGVLIGAVFVARVDDTAMRRTIGVLLLGLVAVHLAQRQFGGDAPEVPSRRRRHGVALVFGLLAGFTTMVANAGGPVMSIYLLSSGAGMMGFLGTTAWFFFLVNAFKVPFSVGLGLISAGSLGLDAVLIPAVLAGAFVGRRVVRGLDQILFDRLVIVFTVVSSLNLVR